jgi:hypothetical protein
LILFFVGIAGLEMALLAYFLSDSTRRGSTVVQAPTVERQTIVQSPPIDRFER